jgi:hypothetical protein
LTRELQDFLRNPWGSTALLLGAALPWLLSIVLAMAILSSVFLLPRSSMDERLFNLALLFLIFLVWVALVDQGIILFVYFLREQLYGYQWSWPAQQGRRPGIVQLAAVALAMFLVLGLITALLPLVWSVGSPTLGVLGLASQDFWRGVLVAFLLSMSFASFVLFLMLLDAADYIARRNKQTVPPIYMDVNKLLKVVLDTVRKQLEVESLTLLSLQRTKSGGLQVLLGVPLEVPKEGEISPQYEVESDQWGFLVNLKEKRDW